jgi:ABC-2 type transport system ATP-binding protein
MEIAELRNVCKTYPAFCLRDVSFSLESGKITGFIGRNGAGKTTTIKAMLNLIHTDSGEISYFGTPLHGHETEIKQRIGYSTGTVSWYPRKSIREIIEITRCFYPAWDAEACRRYMALFGLDERKKPIELSEGMKVKFNLLLALSHRDQYTQCINFLVIRTSDRIFIGTAEQEKLRLERIVGDHAEQVINVICPLDLVDPCDQP